MVNSLHRRVIVISAVNLTSGGPLTILQNCLKYLSESPLADHYRIVALVHSRQTCNFDKIEYIEFPDAKKNWLRRLTYEYFKFRKLSKELAPYLWVSLHDTSPRVKAERQAVYMHNPSPFYRWKWRDLYFDYKYVLFALFYQYLYRINIRNNDFLVVQQGWLREAFAQMFRFPEERIIVSRPISEKREHVLRVQPIPVMDRPVRFIFASLPRPFKNFEVICKAVEQLNHSGENNFEMQLTLDGTENRYAAWLQRKYKNVAQLKFVGLIPHDKMDEFYRQSDCLIFPSKLETWGLPISEYSVLNKPMLVADLPYAHETAAGSSATGFFDPEDATSLANAMLRIIRGDYSGLHPIPELTIKPPFNNDWGDLFRLLLGETPEKNQSRGEVKNKYSLSTKIQLAWWLLRTKWICRQARLIRFPFVIRGRKQIDMGSGLTTGNGCRLEAFSSEKKIVMHFGRNVQINDYVHISAMQNVTIGNNVLMASHIYISDNSHGSYKGTSEDTPPETPPMKRSYSIAAVEIGDNVWLGEHVVVLPGVTIGQGAVIGANSVVSKSIPEYTIAVGQPAKPIKKFSIEKQKWQKL